MLLKPFIFSCFLPFFDICVDILAACCLAGHKGRPQYCNVPTDTLLNSAMEGFDEPQSTTSPTAGAAAGDLRALEATQRWQQPTTMATRQNTVGVRHLAQKLAARMAVFAAQDAGYRITGSQ